LKKFILIILIAASLSSHASLLKSSCLVKWEKIKSTQNISEEYSVLENLCGEDLKHKILEISKNNIDLGYSLAREIMFSVLDNVSGVVCSVYSELCLSTDHIPDSSVMNCEHSWPQSLGAVGIAKDDLHHLFPVESKINSVRGNKPFCEVSKVTWSQEGSSYGLSNLGTKCFEPPQSHKGDLARAMFYFSIRYSKPIDAEQEKFFRKWSIEDKVDLNEIKRNNLIEDYQKNRNPFVDIPDLITLIDDF